MTDEANIEHQIRAAAIVRTNPLLAILQQRQKVHGDFSDDAEMAQAIKELLRKGRNWHSLNAMQREVFEQMATKMGRILSGDPNHKDHWDDLAGYPTLISRTL